MIKLKSIRNEMITSHTKSKYSSIHRKQILKEVSSLLLEETRSSGSIEAERVLAILLSIQRISTQKLSALLDSNIEDGIFLKSYVIKFLPGSDPVKVYSTAISSIRKLALPGSASQIGASVFPTTSQWINYGGIKSAVSKSDIAAREHTFSVKQAQRGSQVRVLDAAFPQLKALVNFTIDRIGVSDVIQKSIKIHLNKMHKLYGDESAVLVRLKDSSNKNIGLSQMRKVTNAKVAKLITAFDTNSKQIQLEINDIFRKMAESPNFKGVFIYESLSGKTMFGESSTGRADSILTWNQDFSKINNHDIANVTKKIISTFKIPVISTKTSGNRVTKTAQMYLAGEAINAELSTLDQLVITESNLSSRKSRGIITEGVFLDIWNSIKEAGVAAIEKILSILESFITGAIDAISNAWYAGMIYLGLDIDIAEPVSLDADFSYENL